MVIKRSASGQVGKLLEHLLGEDVSASETAAARLVILGPRALPHLEGLLGRELGERPLMRVLDVLERMSAPRAAALAAPLLSDAREAIACAAAGVVRKGLASNEPAVAAAALQALLATASAASERPAVARVALAALSDLPAPILEPLRQATPAFHTETATATSGDEDESQRLLRQWIESASASEPVELIRLALEACSRSAPLSLLHAVVERARKLERGQPPVEADAWRNLRGLAHQALGARGSRVALYDLRETMGAQPNHLTIGMLGALSALADRSDLDGVAAAWATATDPSQKLRLEEVGRTLAARHGVDMNTGAGRQFALRHADFAERLSRPSQTTPSRRRRART
ncbi:MAG: hypothetical protein AB7I50_09465 [Vicinamibacterales bacterium]